jgi:hypothetical protein
VALTTAQYLALFEALEVPYCTSRYEVVDDDGMSALQYEATSAEAVKTKVVSHVAALASAIETELVTLLTRWIAIGTNVTTIESGSTGGVSGVNDSPMTERALIREKIKVIVPFWRAHERVKIASHRPTTIPFIR